MPMHTDATSPLCTLCVTNAKNLFLTKHSPELSKDTRPQKSLWQLYPCRCSPLYISWEDISRKSSLVCGSKDSRDAVSWETLSGICTVPLTTATPPSTASKFPVPFCTMTTNSMNPAEKLLWYKHWNLL